MAVSCCGTMKHCAVRKLMTLCYCVITSIFPCADMDMFLVISEHIEFSRNNCFRWSLLIAA